MLKKIIIIFVILVLIFITIKRPQDEREIVTFSSWGSITEVQIINKIIKEFEKNNPDIKISFVHVPQNYFQKLHLLFASKTEPDVIFINNIYFLLYKKYLLDLSEITDKNNFYPQAIECFSDDSHLYAIPRDISNLVFYVNKDILKKLSIDLPDSDWTLEDLFKILAKVQTLKTYGISYEDKVYWLSPYLSYFGGGILDDDGNLIIKSKESLEGIEFYKNLRYKYGFAPQKSEIGSSTLAQMFLDEKICFYLSGHWMYPKIQEKATFNWAVINFPYGKTPQLIDSSGWAISKRTKHKESAIKFLKFLAQKETYEYFAQTGLLIPAYKSVAEDYITNPQHNEKVFLEVINHSKRTPVNEKYNKINDMLNMELDL